MLGQPERRFKVLCVSEGDVLDLFAFGLGSQLPKAVCLPVFDPPIPAGVVVHTVRHDPFFRSFRFLLSHPDFEPVPEGVHPPDLWPGVSVKVRLEPVPTAHLAKV